MLSLQFSTLVTLVADALLIVFCLALAVLLMWQDARRRSTRYFALCMIIFALHGVVHLIWQVPRFYDLDPKPLISTALSLYALGIVMLFHFICSFAGLERRARFAMVGGISLVGASYLVLIWTDRVIRDFEPLSTGGYTYTYRMDGLVAVGALFFFLLVAILVLRRRDDAKSHALLLPLLLLLLGDAVVHPLGSHLRVYPIHSLSILAAVLMLGRTVLTFHVYQPLAALNRDLIAKIIELDEALQRKAQFLTNMSHELRTPLNSIIGYTELVVNRTYGDLTPIQEDRLKKVMRNGHILLELINDVLDLSRIEAGRLSLSLERVGTNDLLEGLIDSVEPQAKDKGLTLLRSYGKLPALWVDQARAKQILSNLLSNAVKFTEQGVVIVRGYYDLGRQQVVISVTDTGPGIPVAKQARLFDVYRRPESPVRQHEGTGLGLPLASQLTGMHGGKLWFETEPERGTTFHVALPAFDDSVNIQRTVQPRTRSDGPVILVIDDDYEAVELSQDQLEQVGYRVYGSATANDGLRLASELKPLLIILDLAMPDLDGWRILDSLRGDPSTAAIPILIISARDEDSSRREQVNGFLSKPVEPDTLRATVRKITGQPHPVERARWLTPAMRHRPEEEHV